MPFERTQNAEIVLAPLQLVWRNPEALVQAHLRLREASDLYSGWAEQARRIRARRANWNVRSSWITPC